MKQFTLKLNNRLSGIKETSVGFSPDSDSRFADTDGYDDASASDSIRIRQLNGRIKILEMELQKAREESFQAGYGEGQRSSFHEANKSVEAMRIEMHAMELKYLETIEQIEAPLLELAKRLAQEVLAVELKHRDDFDDILFERLRKMLYEVVDQNKVIIEVNPEQMAATENSQLNENLNLPKKMNLNVLPAKDLKKGEARIETEDFLIDGTFHTQIEHLGDSLKNKAD